VTGAAVSSGVLWCHLGPFVNTIPCPAFFMCVLVLTDSFECALNIMAVLMIYFVS